ncbi:VOC family protein [Plantactinospora sonchi]|uniref:VOC family protein n=1 Tax=Plantactinospora sonchi TaxID=1544735 RepID=A0ABU7RQS8_9ACTN
MTPVDLIEIVGSLLILSAFAAAQTSRLSPDSLPYLVFNLSGSAVLAVIALADRSWGFLLLEGSWALISAVGLVRAVYGKARFTRPGTVPAAIVTTSPPAGGDTPPTGDSTLPPEGGAAPTDGSAMSQVVPDPSVAPFGLRTAAHVGISVSDLDRSVAFYQALTGVAPVVRDETMRGGGFARAQGLPITRLRYATFHLENLGIDLVQFQEPAGEHASVAANRPGSMHLCFQVDDLRGVHQRMRDAGIEFLGEPYTFVVEEVSPPDAAGTEVAYFNDPDGTNLELIAPRGGFARSG